MRAVDVRRHGGTASKRSKAPEKLPEDVGLDRSAAVAGAVAVAAFGSAHAATVTRTRFPYHEARGDAAGRGSIGVLAGYRETTVRQPIAPM